MRKCSRFNDELLLSILKAFSECTLTSAFLGDYAATRGNSWLTFRDNLSVSSSRGRSLKMASIGCPEASLRYSPEQRISHLLRGGSLRSLIALSSSCLSVSLDVRKLQTASFNSYRRHYFSNLPQHSDFCNCTKTSVISSTTLVLNYELNANNKHPNIRMCFSN